MLALSVFLHVSVFSFFDKSAVVSAVTDSGALFTSGVAVVKKKAILCGSDLVRERHFLSRELLLLRNEKEIVTFRNLF